MRMRRTTNPVCKAEGKCNGFPYNTELVSADGVAIHFWVGTEQPSDDLLERTLSAARYARDIVGATWSFGDPDGFWAHASIPGPDSEPAHG